MHAKALRWLVFGAILALWAPAASGQYIPRPRSGQAGTAAAAGQDYTANPAGLGLAFVTYLSGDSLLLSTDAEDWEGLFPNLSLRIGDRVWAQDDARVEIRFPLGATAWVNYQSELDVTRMERGSRADTIQLALVSGEATFDVQGFSRTGSVFQVDIPSASIRALRAAQFRVNTLPDGTAQIGIIGGTVVIETPDGLVDVSGGQMAELQPDRRVVLDFLPVSDEWDSWVGSRAAIYDRPAASARHLPSDLSSYAHEFDTSGRWFNDPTYGWVWAPAVEQGWSPYSNGRWVWQANDYIWLGYDPWYAPFHYGRWNWGASSGWFWIAPQGRSYWSPGYVGWSVSGDEVSWVPLGRNEVYYGYGNYGPGTVNVSISTNTNVTHAYINSNVSNGVVVVRRDNFLHGTIVRQRIAAPENSFQGGGAGGVKIIARPPVLEIKPIRETRQPRPAAEIKRVSLPPARLEKESKTIKERIVAPTKEKSVFMPGNKPSPLKNVVKEKDLERWIVPKKQQTPRTAVAPPPAVRLKKAEAPGQPSTPVVQSRGVQAQPPAGKHQFKRVLESLGRVNVAPAPAVAPQEEPKNAKEQQPAGELRRQGIERRPGKDK